MSLDYGYRPVAVYGMPIAQHGSLAHNAREMDIPVMELNA